MPAITVDVSKSLFAKEFVPNDMDIGVLSTKKCVPSSPSVLVRMVTQTTIDITVQTIL